MTWDRNVPSARLTVNSRQRGKSGNINKTAWSCCHSLLSSGLTCYRLDWHESQKTRSRTKSKHDNETYLSYSVANDVSLSNFRAWNARVQKAIATLFWNMMSSARTSIDQSEYTQWGGVSRLALCSKRSRAGDLWQVCRTPSAELSVCYVAPKWLLE